MSTEHRSLLMNANRRLGAALVDHNLVKIEDLEKANERLLEIVGTNQPRQSTVLGVLAYEMKVLREEDVLSHLVESESVGLVDLREYDSSRPLIISAPRCAITGRNSFPVPSCGMARRSRASRISWSAPMPRLRTRGLRFPPKLPLP